MGEEGAGEFQCIQVSGTIIIDGKRRHKGPYTTRHDTTRHDTTRHDTTRHDTTRHDTTRHDTTRNTTCHVASDVSVHTVYVSRYTRRRFVSLTNYQGHLATHERSPPVLVAAPIFTASRFSCEYVYVINQQCPSVWILMLMSVYI